MPETVLLMEFLVCSVSLARIKVLHFLFVLNEKRVLLPLFE